MDVRARVLLAARAIIWVAVLTGCSSVANTPELKVGDCVELGGTADRPTASPAACGSYAANFKVVATVADRQQCPVDVDSSYTMHSAFRKSASTACLDIDWVVGGCMSRGGDDAERSDEEERRAVTVDPERNTDPARVDCTDRTARHRQRATEILHGVANVDQCASGLGYAYDERRFTVCVEDVN